MDIAKTGWALYVFFDTNIGACGMGIKDTLGWVTGVDENSQMIHWVGISSSILFWHRLQCLKQLMLETPVDNH